MRDLATVYRGLRLCATVFAENHAARFAGHKNTVKSGDAVLVVVLECSLLAVPWEEGCTLGAWSIGGIGMHLEV